jgi:hypothetical protein
MMVFKTINTELQKSRRTRGNRMTVLNSSYLLSELLFMPNKGTIQQVSVQQCIYTCQISSEPELWSSGLQQCVVRVP